jgi:hypothetical protein
MSESKLELAAQKARLTTQTSLSLVSESKDANALQHLTHDDTSRSANVKTLCAKDIVAVSSETMRVDEIVTRSILDICDVCKQQRASEVAEQQQKAEETQS